MSRKQTLIDDVILWLTDNQ